jgi:hypothetical protein
MAKRSETLCFDCGQAVGDPPRLNRHEDGSPCRRCADRALDSLPPALPAPRQAPEGSYEFDLPGADFQPGDDPESA